MSFIKSRCKRTSSLSPWKSSLKYTLTFLACQADEEGLLEIQFFMENADRHKIIADISFESTPV
jgi:hypothetical protein